MNPSVGPEFNNLLSGELSAVETYDLALKHDFDSDTAEDLRKCRNCHQDRVDKLVEQVVANEEKPCSSSGPFGAIAKMVENSAASSKAALQLLEELEAERLVQYENQRKIVSPEVLPFLEQELLEAQHNTHLIISTRARKCAENQGEAA